MEISGYVAMLFVGASLGLIGGGGAILTMPIMVYLFHVPPVRATSYSLFVVGVSSLLGVWRYHQKNLVAYRTAVIFALPSFLGTYLARRVVTPHLPDVIFQFGDRSFTKDHLVMTVFAIVMISAATLMIRPSKTPSTPRGPSKLKVFLPALGFAVGFVAGFVGAGGGFLIIPSLVILANIPMLTAIGTSLLIIYINSIAGFSGDVLAGIPIPWHFLAATTGIAMIGTFAGSYASRYISPAKLKALFGYFVLLMGTVILLSELRL